MLFKDILRPEMHTKVCPEKLQERDHLEDLTADESTMLKWILKRQGKRRELDSTL
jgi:hypothetical protein